MNTDLATLLLVDDTPDNLLILSDTFIEAQYRVLVAESGEMAIVSAQHGLPDLAVVDVRMPGMDGFETCRQLKSLVGMNDVPIILTSAHVTAETWNNGLAAGASDVISKPFTNLEVLTRIALHLRLQQLQRTISSTSCT